MPRTKLDKYARRTMSKAEKDADTIRCAFSRKGIFKQVDMAKAIGAGEATISKGFKNGFSLPLLYRIHAVVNFTAEEREELMWKSASGRA